MGSRDSRIFEPCRPNRSRGACDDAKGFWERGFPYLTQRRCRKGRCPGKATLSWAVIGDVYRPDTLVRSPLFLPTKSSSPSQPLPVNTSIREMENKANGRSKLLGPS